MLYHYYNCRGSRELITGMDYGTVLEQNQGTGVLKNAIEYVLDNPELRRKAVENNYNRVLEHFTWDARAEGNGGNIIICKATY